MTEQTEPTNGKAALDSFAANATEMAPNGEQVTPEDWTQFERNDIQAALSARHVTPEWFKDKLPPERFLLTQLPRQGAETEAPGVMPEGDVCMLIGEGGVGKTWLAIQLALSVATGKAWFGAFHVPNPGPVLLMLGESKPDGARRRVHLVAEAMGLDAGELDLAFRNLTVLPMHGKRPRFISEPGPAASGEHEETEAYRTLRAYLRADIEKKWRAVILDPLARFAGADTEKDSAAATYFVALLEKLTQRHGSPAVVVTHHTNKTGRVGKNPGTVALRGSSALGDGARWVAVCESLKSKDESLCGARFSVTKVNDGPHVPSQVLAFSSAGVLEKASEEQRDLLQSDDDEPDEPRGKSNYAKVTTSAKSTQVPINR